MRASPLSLSAQSLAMAPAGRSPSPLRAAGGLALFTGAPDAHALA